jgi:tetratricopeptide (TPR) repeat protein
MSDERIVEQFKLLKRAKKLEEMGNNERALDLYLELHEKYDPNTSDAYERPAIILERMKRYEEALAFCQDAIEQIEEEKISGTKDKFLKRIDHINAKLETVPTKSPEKDVNDKAYAFGIIGFRHKNKAKMLTALVFLCSFYHFGCGFKVTLLHPNLDQCCLFL